jgi:SAM-dependent methyltransferase
MNMPDKEAKHWGGVARGWSDKGYANELLGEQKRKTYIDLISRWTKITPGQKILKTDLFAEAFTVEQFFFDAIPAKSYVIGIDVAFEIVAEAKSQAQNRGMDTGGYLCSDVKKLPLKDSSIDLIISDSTLDHFPTEAEIITALKELGRVLADGGTLILTIDNKSNLTYPPYFFIRLWMKLGLNVEDNTAILHYPHPDGLLRLLERSLRNLSRGRLDGAIRRTLACLNRLEGSKVKYLTGRYLAIKAVKRGTA